MRLYHLPKGCLCKAAHFLFCCVCLCVYDGCVIVCENAGVYVEFREQLQLPVLALLKEALLVSAVFTPTIACTLPALTWILGLNACRALERPQALTLS